MDPDTPIMQTDVSLIRNEQDRLLVFFLLGKMESDPAMCAPEESTCVLRVSVQLQKWKEAMEELSS
jgi:hypothetical protein